MAERLRKMHTVELMDARRILEGKWQIQQDPLSKV